jgi:hypothetical protein
MKSRKKKVAFPRRSWQINPVTRVNDSSKKHLRSRVEWDLQKQDWQGYAAARPAERRVSPTVAKLKWVKN